MRDSWQGQTSRLSSSAAHTSLWSLLRFCCLLLLTAPISFPFLLSYLSLSLSPWQKTTVYVHTKRLGRIRGRGRLRRLRRWGLYAGRQVEKRDMWQPVLPLRLPGRVQVPKPVQPITTRRSRVVRVAGRSRRSAEAPELRTLHKLRHYV